MARPPSPDGPRVPIPLRLHEKERDEIVAAAERAGAKGWSTWSRDLLLAVARGDYPKSVARWLQSHGFIPRDDET